MGNPALAGLEKYKQLRSEFEIHLSNKSLLALLFCVQLLIYFDRGLVASFIPQLKTDLLPQPISDTSIGIIGSAFVLGFMLACPIFAYLAKSHSIYPLMTVGLTMWIGAIVMCGSTISYSAFLVSRILSGIGEASFAGLAPTIIDDIAPKAYRTSWLSIFYAALPIGGAIGYVLGGVFVRVSWHLGFFAEACLMVPLVFILHLLTPHTDKKSTAAVDASSVSMSRSNSVPNLQHLSEETSEFVRSDQVRVPTYSASPVDTSISVPAADVQNGNASVTGEASVITKRQTGAADDMLIPTSNVNSRSSSRQSSPRNKKSSTKKKAAQNVRFASSMEEQQFPSASYQSTQSLYDSVADDSDGSASYGHTSGFQRTTSVPYKAAMDSNSLYDTYNNTLNHSDYDHEESDIVTDIMTLLTEPIYLMIVLGLSALTFVIGGMSFWAPAEYAKLLGLSANQVTTAIGIITLVTGIVGTWMGGVILDMRGGGKGYAGVARAMEMSTVFTSISIMFATISVMTHSAIITFTALTIADLFMFASSAPVNASLLTIAPTPLRSLAMAMSILLMHALGDLPSPLVVGYVSDLFATNTQFTMLVMCSWMCWAILLWGSAAYMMRKKIKRVRKGVTQSLLNQRQEHEELGNYEETAPLVHIATEANR